MLARNSRKGKKKRKNQRDMGVGKTCNIIRSINSRHVGDIVKWILILATILYNKRRLIDF
jgi:hypothetical protein